jgi:hypothetical protein
MSSPANRTGPLAGLRLIDLTAARDALPVSTELGKLDM